MLASKEVQTGQGRPKYRFDIRRWVVEKEGVAMSLFSFIPKGDACCVLVRVLVLVRGLVLARVLVLVLVVETQWGHIAFTISFKFLSGFQFLNSGLFTCFL